LILFAQKFLTGWELEEDVSSEEVCGSLLAFSSFSLLQSGNLAVSGLVGFGAAVLAVTKGLPGDSARLVGSAAWGVGRRIKKLSEKSSVQEGFVTISSSLLRRSIQLISSSEDPAIQPTKTIPWEKNQQIRDLEELRAQIYACYDHFNEELETLEIEILKSDGRYKMELSMIEEDLKDMKDEWKRF
jgi:hypothetical protein